MFWRERERRFGEEISFRCLRANFFLLTEKKRERKSQKNFFFLLLFDRCIHAMPNHSWCLAVVVTWYQSTRSYYPIVPSFWACSFFLTSSFLLTWVSMNRSWPYSLSPFDLGHSFNVTIFVKVCSIDWDNQGDFAMHELFFVCLVFLVPCYIYLFPLPKPSPDQDKKIGRRR